MLRVVDVGKSDEEYDAEKEKANETSKPDKQTNRDSLYTREFA